jgi:hypothetical protein
MNLRHPAFVARLTAAAGGASGPGTLLGEMKYTGYSIGQGVPNNTVVDGFATWCDWGLSHIVQS